MEISAIPWQQTIPLRHRVLWPMKPQEFCHVDGDQDAMHFGAFVQDELVCVASVFIESNKARLRKFATLAEFQNQGIGSQMLTKIIESLKTTSADVFWCDARESAVGFYQRFGMNAFGDVFYKENVAYYKMQIDLT